ncbi:winged helix-turn-helix domain-containing protein [Streptomyces cupreus]|uniref:Helix-turn-helix transcriptional regulator n=1 Tax=Streptomyces cupreus TaxID=2759956 RepID=A0A7X1JAG3_9ACTN|nr:winged helix-turn-helix domain-containing protein [Streptomyces cupreus]MBC2904662.1 helix-turn-helix transcriptional regulator [Streptomyces cupreus]
MTIDQITLGQAAVPGGWGDLGQAAVLGGTVEFDGVRFPPRAHRTLTRLQRHGPATSADLAAEFDEDRGATSYHLRQLARFGFTEEDTARSSGRRKYWWAILQGVRLPRDPADPRTAAAAAEVGRQWLEGR